MSGAVEFAPSRFPPTSGAVVMAFGVFAAAALGRLPGAGWASFLVIAGLVAVAWLVLVGGFLAAWQNGLLGSELHAPLAGFSLGTWVAGTAILARLAELAGSALDNAARLLLAIAAALWIIFTARAMRHLVRILLRRARAPPNGIILLSTVATQAVAVMGFRLLPGAPAVRLAATLLCALGLAAYLFALALLLRRYLGPDWRLAEDWSDTNCMLHGALSISGLTLVVGRVVPDRGWAAVWLVVLCIFVFVEGTELIRLALRVRASGWREGLLRYDVAQWARNFTFGMFYAFTLHAFEALGEDRAMPWLRAAQAPIVLAGPYLVALFLAAESALAVAALLGAGPMPARRPSLIADAADPSACRQAPPSGSVPRKG